MRLYLAITILGLACWASPSLGGRYDPRGAYISLHAKWNATPILLETAEFLSDEDPAYLWSFVERWHNQQPASKDQCWESIVHAASAQLTGDMSKVMQLVVGVRQYSPKLEMYRQLSSQSAHAQDGRCCWAEVGSKAASTPGELAPLLKEALTSAAPSKNDGPDGSQQQQQEVGEGVYPFDHLYPGTTPAHAADAAGAVVVVLYGSLGTPCFKAMHEALAKAADEHDGSGGSRQLLYVWRPVLPSACSAPSSLLGAEEGSLSSLCAEHGAGGLPLQLPGFGAEFVIKNMEYKTLDDSKKLEQPEQGEGDEDSGPAQVRGFDFQKLRQRRPELKKALGAFKDHLLESALEDDTLKVWDMKDLGVLASQRVLQATDPLFVLTELSQNFPSRARSVSQGSVDPALAGELGENQRLLPGGRNLMVLNGVLMDMDELDLFKLMDRIRDEVRLSDALRETGLGLEDVLSLMLLRSKQAAKEADDVTVTLDDGAYQGGADDDDDEDDEYGEEEEQDEDGGAAGSGDGGGGTAAARKQPAILWLNNVETDPLYKRWGQNLYDLLSPMMPGRMHRIARNLYNGVLIADLSDASGLAGAASLGRVLSDGFPIRLGLLPVCPSLVQQLAAQSTAAAGDGDGGGDEVVEAPWDEKLPVCEKLGRMAIAVASEFGSKAASDFLHAAATSAAPDAEELELTDQQIKDGFDKRWAKWSKHSVERMPSADAWKLLTQGEGFASEAAGALRHAAACAFAKGLGQAGTQFYMNGQVQQQHNDWRTTIMYAAMYEMQALQEMVYYERLSDSPNMYGAILKVRGALPRTNPAIFAGDPEHTKEVRLVGDVLSPRSNPVVASLGYLQRPGTGDQLKSVSMWVVGDLATPVGRQLALESLKFLSNSQASSSCRVALLHNPADAASPVPLLARVVSAAAAAPSRRDKVPGFLVRLLQAARGYVDDKALLQGALELAEESGLSRKWLEEALTQMASGAATPGSAKQLAAKHAAIARALGLRAGAAAVSANGRVLVVHDGADLSSPPTLSIIAEDFPLIAMQASQGLYVDGIGALLEEAAEEGRATQPAGSSGGGGEQEVEGSAGEGAEPMTAEQLSDTAMIASSVLGADKAQVDALNVRLMAALDNFASEHSAVDLQLHGGLPLQFITFLNPLSRTAQRLSPLLVFVRDALQVSVRLYMNPVRELSEMPLKTFYRYSLPEVETRGDVLHFVSPPVAHFSSLPPTKVLTLHMDVPEAWLVEASRAEYDLDNFRPEDLGNEPYMYAEFELEALLLTGSCIDSSARTREQMTPRGVQLRLGSSKQRHLVDTLVMSNLGYFQLKSAPGIWYLQLAPGRSTELYTVVGSSGVSSEVESGAALKEQRGASDSQVPVIISSFSGKHMKLKVNKRPGMEEEDVLGEAPSEARGKAPAIAGGGGGLLSSWWGGAKDEAEKQEEDDDVINIFTVASGHMYERLQKIMALSVTKNTKRKVKFWFIKNYMSPQMKAFVPHMAAKYGFGYEFVTYKWPEWLHKQTDKQRIIWAYKILFLDVLFPLGVNKVIFVDSDQVIRGDMEELWTMDLKGAPYGYTPFCDNNKDMDGFRFWTQGFWRDHLRGKPYHISALYVVDLARFRQIAAGDQLRVIYDSLSRDPNSLANLDQDLPNYAQHQVPIFSLPQEWLWCETWCGNATKSAAKTIDLCNNPLTKEPKLVGARRIVKEWPALDEEAMAFTQQVEAMLEGREASDASSEHDELAGDGAACSPGDGSGAQGQCSASGGAQQQKGSDHDDTEL